MKTISQTARWWRERTPIMREDSIIFRIPLLWRLFPRWIFVPLTVAWIYVRHRAEKVFILQIALIFIEEASFYPMSMWEREPEFFLKMRREWAMPIFALLMRVLHILQRTILPFFHGFSWMPPAREKGCLERVRKLSRNGPRNSLKNVREDRRKY